MAEAVRGWSFQGPFSETIASKERITTLNQIQSKRLNWNFFQLALQRLLKRLPFTMNPDRGIRGGEDACVLPLTVQNMRLTANGEKPHPFNRQNLFLTA